jgi:hypothetical protein
MSRQWPEAIRKRKVAEALRLYARLLVEHERVRRLRGGTSGAAARWCRPAPQVWRPPQMPGRSSRLLPGGAGLSSSRVFPCFISAGPQATWGSNRGSFWLWPSGS